MECSTWVLAIFTGILALSTIIYTYVTYKLYKGSKNQVEALNKQVQAILELTKAVNQIPIVEQIVKDRKDAAEKIKKLHETNNPQRRALTGRH